jgi:tripartite ATP-independent transporter DctP family solute receptor
MCSKGVVKSNVGPCKRDHLRLDACMRVTSRRTFLIGCGALGATHASQAYTRVNTALTAADVHVAGYPTVEAVRWIGERIDKETQGRLRIRVYHAGQLGRESDTVGLARFGALDFTRVNFAPLNNPFPLTQIFSLPYVFDSVAHMRRAADGEPGQAVLKSFEQRDLVGLAIYDAGTRSFYNVARPVREPGDLKGLKIRVPPSDIFIELARALGANPTPLPYGEVYSAMQTHLIDGAENNWRTLHTSRQFEVARYWSGTEHSHSPEALLMSKRTFDELSADDQQLMLHAARESVPYMRSLWDRMEEDSKQHVIASGIEVSEIDMGAFRRAAQPMLDRYLQSTTLRSLYSQIRSLA